MNRKFRFFLMGFFSSTLAMAGEWGSSGGEFLRDQHNPWFVKSTGKVQFCLHLDAKGFSASREKSLEMISLAIQYWKKELSDSGAHLGLGTQEVVPSQAEGNCTGNEDLEFRLGYGALNEEQLNFFKQNKSDPQNYAGVAVRTHYDRVNLRGRGFIFVSSDRGSHPYNFGGIEENLWSHEGLLFRILQHELGHVFGVAHTEDGFMAADFPENMIRQFRAFRSVKSEPFFEPIGKYNWCPDELPTPGACMEVESKDHWDTFSIQNPLHDGESSRFQGRVIKKYPPKLSFPLKIYITPEQKVFSVQTGEAWLKGPARKNMKMMATREGEAETGSTPILIDLFPERIELFFYSLEGLAGFESRPRTAHQ